MPLAAGTRIGPYEIVSPLGSGGMGEVYRAHDATLRRDVALKVLPTVVAADLDRLARFRREAQVLAALNHPHIAHVYGFEDALPARPGSDEARHALVMELVEGPTLADLIARSRVITPSGGSAGRRSGLPVDQAIDIARQLADAMEAAHEQGVIHRDLKPANIKVKEDGAVKVLDFGRAKAMERAGASSPDAVNSPTIPAHATQTGIIIGTAAYMAPEQARGRPVDRRADIWAFGVVLYEMLTGDRAFAGEDVSETLASVLKSSPDFSALPSATPPRLRRLIERCLVRDPKQRLRDMGDARLEIEAIASGGADPAETHAALAVAARAPVWTAALPWALTVLALVTAAASAWRAAHVAPLHTTTVTRAKTVLAKPNVGIISIEGAGLSSDGRRFVYSALDDKIRLKLRSMDQLDDQSIPGAEGGVAAMFSPDGQSIAFQPVDDEHIKRIPVTGGASTTLCEGSLENGGAWGDDDTIVFSGPKGLMRVSAQGGSPQLIAASGGSDVTYVEPQFLPGGRRLLFTERSALDSRDPDQFAVLDLENGKVRAIGPGGLSGRYASTGHLTFVRGQTLYAVSFDLGTLAVTGPETPVVDDLELYFGYALSDTGVLVYVPASAHGSTLAWADRKGATQPLPGLGVKPWGTGHLSPDGTRVAIGLHETETIMNVFVIDVARGNPVRLTAGGTNDNPVWSPDGRTIFYGGTVDGKSGIWSVPSDGSGTPVPLTATDTLPTVSSVTPDGQALLFHRMVAGRLAIFVLDHPQSGGTHVPRLLHEGTSSSESNAIVSPNGRWVAYSVGGVGGVQVYAQAYPGPGGRVRVSTHGGTEARWSHDGRELLYYAPRSGKFMSVAIDRSSLQASEPALMFALSFGTTWDVAPGNQRFLVELIDATPPNYVVVTNWFDELRRLAKPKGQ